MSTLVYGLHDLETLKDERVETIGISEWDDRITEWNAEVNRNFNTIMSLVTTRDEKWNAMPIAKHYTPSVARMQPVDEHGVAKPHRETGSFQVGLPMWRREQAIGFSYEALKKVTIGEYSRQLAMVDRADMDTHIDLLLFSLFYDTNWDFISTEENFPDVPVKALANGDTITYTVRGESAPQTADHYQAQAGDIATTDPFPNIAETLRQYTSTSPNGRIIAFVGGSTNVSQIKALDGFYRVDRTGFISWGDNVSLVDPSADMFIGMGDEVLGEHEDGVLIIRWRRLPDDYILAFNLDAPAPIGIREDTEPTLRGLFRIDATENSGNTLLSRFRRKIGFAPVNRTSAMVVRVGNGTYAPPTGFTAIPA
jgi:hypothetical protein